MDRIERFKKAFANYDASGNWARLTPAVLRKILESAFWNVKMAEVQRYRKALADFDASNRWQELDPSHLRDLLESIAWDVEMRYGRDFLHDYFGIGSELL